MHTSTSGMHATSSFNLSSIHSSPLYKNFVNASTNQQTSAQAAWLHTTNNKSINVMRAHGYSDAVDRIAADDSRLNVYRPGTKVPSNKLGLGYALATSQSKSIHTYAANTISTQEPYTAAHQALDLPNPDSRAGDALLAAHTIHNGNKEFRNRMLQLIHHNRSDDISLWHLNNHEEVLRHDLIQQHIVQAQQARAIANQHAVPSLWQQRQSRRSAEQRRNRTMHHFKAVSSSGSSIYLPPSPVVSHPITTLSSLPSLSNTTSTSRSAVTVAGTLPRCADTLSAVSSSSSSSSSNGGHGAGVGASGAVFSQSSSGANPGKTMGHAWTPQSATKDKQARNKNRAARRREMQPK